MRTWSDTSRNVAPHPRVRIRLKILVKTNVSARGLDISYATSSETSVNAAEYLACDTRHTSRECLRLLRASRHCVTFTEKKIKHACESSSAGRWVVRVKEKCRRLRWRKERPCSSARSDVPDAGRRSDPRRAVGALSCFPPKIAITKRVRALCVRAARSVWLSRGRIFRACRRRLSEEWKTGSSRDTA